MPILPFLPSKNLSLGIELELQLINPLTFDLFPRAKEFLRSLQESKYIDLIKPEITQAMLEINSSIHDNPFSLEKEMHLLNEFLIFHSKKLEIMISGGGTHPFQHWSSRKIFPTHRFRKVSNRYGYLAKRFTVFAQHTHIGCQSAEDALYLTHMLSRFVPQLICLSASSPFYQGVNTGYCSTRVNIVNAFPLYGVIPYVKTWKEFSDYYYKILDLKIIESMKDLYWDVRPKPEFGTVEIRVCDTPLSVTKAIMIAAYIQTLAHYLLVNRPYQLSPDLYLVYNLNRFEASRYGYDGDFINPFTKQHGTIQDDIISTLKILKPYARALGNEYYLECIKKAALAKQNDAFKLKEIYAQHSDLERIVSEKLHLWSNNSFAKYVSNSNKYCTHSNLVSK